MPSNLWFTAVIVLALQTSVLAAQNSAPSLKLSIGTPQSAVTASYGKPFGHWQLTASEYSAQVGVPTGLWMVYHLNAFGNRMYVTMLHFGHSMVGPQQSVSAAVDSLMLMPNGYWTVFQILNDQPEFGALCVTNCDVIRTTDSAGKVALLLKPETSKPDAAIIYFEGDSAGRIDRKSVASLQGVPQWVYVFRLSDFDSHHADLRKEVIGTWSPEIKPHQ